MGGQRTVIRKEEKSYTRRGRERYCLVRWGSSVLDILRGPYKSVGSLNFLEEERVRFPITDEHSSLAVFAKMFAEFAGLKAEAQKSGLGSCVELKFCRLEKGKYGSKAFAINPVEQWNE